MINVWKNKLDAVSPTLYPIFSFKESLIVFVCTKTSMVQSNLRKIALILSDICHLRKHAATLCSDLCPERTWHPLFQNLRLQRYIFLNISIYKLLVENRQFNRVSFTQFQVTFLNPFNSFTGRAPLLCLSSAIALYISSTRFHSINQAF